MIIKRKLFARLQGFPRTVRNTKYILSTTFGGGNKREAAEKAIKLGRKAEKAQVYLRTVTPEKLVGDVGNFASHRPVQTVATAATFPITGAAAEGALQRVKPYNKFTNWTGSMYSKYLRTPAEGLTKTVISLPW